MSRTLPDPLPEAPAATRADLTALTASLDAAVPAKTLDRNLLVATWNIRNLGPFHAGWVAGPTDRPKRDLESLHAIAEIVSRFDVVAVQEIRGDTSSLRAVQRLLGEDWALLLTDVTEGKQGNDERIGFLFDTRRVVLSGLACEIVIPPEHLAREDADALGRQFARTPYAVGFRCGGHDVTLVSVHVIWGDSPIERVRELRAIAQWLARWSRDKNAWDRNLLALGDFNIERQDDAYHEAFTSTGLMVPPELGDARRSIFGATGSKAALYDQIAWFDDSHLARPFSLTYRSGGSFDFTSAALASRGLTRSDLSWRLSDHLPLWVEFEVPPVL